MNSKNIFTTWFLTICLLTLSGCKDKTQQDVSTEIPVKVTRIASEVNPRENSYVGTVVSNVEAQLSFQVTGNVKRVYARQGQVMRQGQLLAELEDENLRHTNQSAQASLKQAQDGYNRLKALYDNGSLPEVKFVEIQTQLEQAQSLASITAKNLKDTKLYATGMELTHGIGETGIVGRIGSQTVY